MQNYEELKARGLIAQVTDEDEIRELVNNGKATFYIGFDPTADMERASTLSPCTSFRWVELSSAAMSARLFPFLSYRCV